MFRHEWFMASGRFGLLALLFLRIAVLLSLEDVFCLCDQSSLHL